VPVYSSVAAAIDKTKLASDAVYLTLIEIDVLDSTTKAVTETLRFAQNNEDYTFRGETYLRAGFDFSISRSLSELPTVSLTVGDPTQEIQARMHANEGGVDFPVRILVVSTASPDTPELEEAFVIQASSAASDSYSVEFKLGAENPLTLRWPARLQFRNRCLWRYKGNECGYTGELPTCSQILTGANGCEAHGNTLRFGGFRGIVPRG
jgi:hypothetical protein